MSFMEPEKAIELLDKAAATVSSNREGHDVLKQAVNVISEIIRKYRENQTQVS